MRSSMLVSGLFGLAAAMPYDNAGDMGLSVADAPAPMTKRDNVPAVCQWLMFLICSPLSPAYGPTVNPDSPSAFTSSSALAKIATSASTPSGYVMSFQNDDGATSTSNYLGYSELQNYNPSTCSAICDATGGCIGFNIWFERDPSTNTNPWCCPNPTSVTRIKCSLWGTYTSAGTSNNNGQARDSFQVVMAGSNGYNKQPPKPSVTPVVSSAKSTASSVAGVSSASTTSKISSVNPSSIAILGTPSASVSKPSSIGSSAYSSLLALASSFASAGPSMSVPAASSAATSTSRPLSFSSAVPVASGSSSLASLNAGPMVSSSPKASSAGTNMSSQQGGQVQGGQATSAPSPTSAGNTASLPLSAVSNSATIASASAYSTNTGPGSPVTASIPASAAVSSATACATPVAAPQLTFNVNHTTTDNYQTLWLYGSIDQLGSWAVDKAVAMSAFQNTPSNTNWFVALNITAGTYLEYKYFQRNDDWSITWPAMANRVYTVPSSCQGQIELDDQWQ